MEHAPPSWPAPNRERCGRPRLEGPGGQHDVPAAVPEPAAEPVDGRGLPPTARRGARRHGWTRWRALLHLRRERIRRDARANHLYRVAVAVAGTCVGALGLVLVPLPGPGWLVVLIGLAVLGSEFHWARRTHAFVRRRVHDWSDWVSQRSWSLRILLGSVTALLLACVAWGWLAWQGLPEWTPQVVSAQLRWVPGIG